MTRIWDRTEQTLAGVLGLSALGLALWQVVSRYFFPEGAVSGAEEIIVYLMIWAIMIVSSQLVRHDGHVRPDLMLNIAPPAAKRWLEIFNCVAAIVLCAGAIWYGWQVVATALLIDERSASDLRFPMWIYYAALPSGGALMLLRYVIRLAGLVASPHWKSLLPQHAAAHALPEVREPAQ